MKHKKDKDHKLRADAPKRPRRRPRRSRPYSRRAAPLHLNRSTPWSRRASARGPRPHLMRRRRSCSAGCVRLAPGGGAARRRDRTEPLRATWGPGRGRQTNGTARVPRPQRAQLSERARFDSVLCGCPPGNLDPCGVQRDSTSRVEENEGFSSARLGARRRGESWAYWVRGLATLRVNRELAM